MKKKNEKINKANLFTKISKKFSIFWKVFNLKRSI